VVRLLLPCPRLFDTAIRWPTRTSTHQLLMLASRSLTRASTNRPLMLAKLPREEATLMSSSLANGECEDEALVSCGEANDSMVNSVAGAIISSNEICWRLRHGGWLVSKIGIPTLCSSNRAPSTPKKRKVEENQPQKRRRSVSYFQIKFHSVKGI